MIEGLRETILSTIEQKKDPLSAIIGQEEGKEKNLKNCNCSYEPCPRKGVCCDCISYHLSSRQLPACCFPDDVERTYDRSFDRFARLVSQRAV